MHSEQDKSAVKSSAERLKQLRLKTQLRWEDVAERIGISTSMLFQVLRGTRGLSDKADYRLRHAEIEAEQELGIPSKVQIEKLRFENPPGQEEKVRAIIARLRKHAADIRREAQMRLGSAEEIERTAAMLELTLPKNGNSERFPRKEAKIKRKG